VSAKSIVLFVDDDKDLLAGLRRLLRQEPYSIATALDAAAGLQALARQQVDVVVSDQRMPAMNGIDFLAVVAEKYPQTARIMLTGEADLETAVKAINEGEIYRFLIKPCSEIELSICIRQALEHHKLLTQARRMLATLQMQESYIEHLERENPGISHVTRNKQGAIVIDDIPCEAEALLKKIAQELGD
jgi:two-component system, probable response regulator PhcQ